MKRTIRNSAKALILRDGKILAVKLQDGDKVWYILPGGGQETEELLPETVCRETAEELGVRVTVRDLAFVIEGRRGEAFHRVDLVFRCDWAGEMESPVLRRDTMQTGAEWLDISILNTAPLYPSRLRRPIMDLYAGIPHRIYLGNEEIGDPEITD